MAKKTNGAAYIPKGRTHYLIKYYKDGIAVRESTGTTDKEEAHKMLRERMTRIDTGTSLRAAAGKVRWEEAVRQYLVKAENNGRDSVAKMRARFEHHLTPFFKRRLLASITESDLNDYVNARKQQTYIQGSRVTTTGRVHVGSGAALRYSNGSINMELSQLRRVFRLQLHARAIAQMPHFREVFLKRTGTRKGFFTHAEYLRVIAHLPATEAAVVTMAYITGWRMSSEILTLEWSQVEFSGHGSIRIEVGDDKSEAGRVFPLTDDLRALLRERDAARKAAEKAGYIVPWVFFRLVTRKGQTSAQRVRYFMKRWRTACKAAHVQRIPHDLRRTAARNMVRRGVAERVAMQLLGHKTRWVFDAYNISSEADTWHAAQLLAGLTSTGATLPPAGLQLQDGQQRPRA
jgi:integrase